MNEKGWIAGKRQPHIPKVGQLYARMRNIGFYIRVREVKDAVHSIKAICCCGVPPSPLPLLLWQ